MTHPLSVGRFVWRPDLKDFIVSFEDLQESYRDRAEDVDRRDTEEGLRELRVPSGCRGGILRVRMTMSQE